MSYIIIYFSIGLALSIVYYLYSCYDYRVNWKDWSWDRYVDISDTHEIMGGLLFAYPLLLLVLLAVSLRGCVMYIAEYIREYIFKVIDRYFIK